MSLTVGKIEFGPSGTYTHRTASQKVNDNRARRGDWMQTFTGRAFWPMDPRPEEIDIRDIAHSLAMQCRYTGLCRRFYSDAEHCVLMAEYLPQQFAAWALLHDASEAYLVDVPRPVKPFLSGYQEAESRVMDAVCQRFGLVGSMPSEVKEADNRILEDERQQNMATPPIAWGTGPGLGVKLQFWSPERAKAEFLLAAEEAGLV